MKATFITALILVSLASLLPTSLASEAPAPAATANQKISLGEWHAIMERVRSFDEAAITQMMDIIVSKRCPGTAEELVAMLKLAAGMGEKRAQELLSACYQQGVGVRESSDFSRNWRYIYNNL